MSTVIQPFCNMEMKTMKNALCALLLPLLFAGCVAEIDNLQKQEDLHEVVFHAGWDPETKTVLQEDGSVWWSPGDEIALFVNGQKYCLKAACTEPSPTTDFMGKIGQGSGPYYAIYPYDKALSETAFTIPSVQYAKAGGFEPGQFVSLARSDDEYLTFYNVCAGIKFSVAHEGISKIVFKNREYVGPITGNMYIQFPTLFPEEPSISPDYYTAERNLSYTLTVYPAEGDYFVPGEDYYASIRPGGSSLVISFFTDDKVATISFHDRDIKKSSVVILREKDKGLIFKEQHNYSYSELDSNILPDGIDKKSIQEVVFHTSSDVITETVLPSSIPSSVTVFGDDLMEYIPVYFELKGTTAHYYTRADRYMMKGPNCISFMDWSELRNVDLSMFCTNQVVYFDAMFNGCLNLESVDLSSFDTSGGRQFNAMFERCNNLKTLNLGNFSSASLAGVPQGAEGIFTACYSLTKIDLGNFDLSTCGTSHAMTRLAKYSKNCAIRCNSATREKLSDFESRLRSSAKYITWVLPEEDIPDLEPVVDPTLYTSTDYSKDKTVRVLHQATKGKGVDIVLLGDAYSDRMIADGTYDTDMELAMNAILKDEPYASFKEYINVYAVYAVSENEIPYDTRTVFDASINEYDPVNGIVCYSEKSVIYKYASIAFPDKDLEDVAMVLIINQAEGEGTSCTDGVAVYEIDGADANSAKSIGMINRRDRAQTEAFSNIVSHEFGHVFAKLGDEYIRDDCQIPDEQKEDAIKKYNQAGWWSNIDFTSDPSTIKWHKFLEDERYIGTGIGIYEGGYTYAYGVWHPTKSSIMVCNSGMFNAPSREAIYKRIHKLALGKDWQYDFETFVKYDQKNIAAEIAAEAAPEVKSTDSIHPKPFLKIEESVSADGKKTVTIIMN